METGLLIIIRLRIRDGNGNGNVEMRGALIVNVLKSAIIQERDTKFFT